MYLGSFELLPLFVFFFKRCEVKLEFVWVWWCKRRKDLLSVTQHSSIINQFYFIFFPSHVKWKNHVTNSFSIVSHRFRFLSLHLQIFYCHCDDDTLSRNKGKFRNDHRWNDVWVYQLASMMILKDCWHGFDDELELNDCVGNWKTGNHVQLLLFPTPTQSIFDSKLLFSPKLLFDLGSEISIFISLFAFKLSSYGMCQLGDELHFSWDRRQFIFFPMSANFQGRG